jgi:hypothetical protein
VARRAAARARGDPRPTRPRRSLARARQPPRGPARALRGVGDLERAATRALLPTGGRASSRQLRASLHGVARGRGDTARRRPREPGGGARAGPRRRPAGAPRGEPHTGYVRTASTPSSTRSAATPPRARPTSRTWKRASAPGPASDR